MSSREDDLIVYGSGLLWDPPKVNIAKYMLDSMKKYGPQITLINADNGYKQTFDELRLLSVRTALELRTRGITKGDVVAVYSKNYTISQLPFLATLYLGATSLLIHSTYSLNELKIFLNKGTPKIIFCDDDFETKVKSVINELNMTNQIEIINLDKEFRTFTEEKYGEHDFEVVDISDNDIAILAGTSGTNGLIKAVPLTYRTYFMSINTMFEEMKKETCEETLLSYSPLSWSSGFKILAQSIILGARRIVKPNSISVVKVISEYKVTAILAPASQITSMIGHPDFKKYNISSQIKKLFYSGSPATVEQAKLFRQTFPNAWCFNAYGSTEMCATNAFFHENDKLNAEKLNSNGKLVNNTNGKIIDIENGNILGRNQIGEILIQNPYMMKGYWKDPESTRYAFDADGWFHTGDLGYFDEDDCLYCTGRLKETFKYNGIQVNPLIVEDIIQGCPGVQSVCVVGKKDPICNNVPVAFIIKRKGYENLTDKEVLSFTEGNFF
ncbi:4-coumarate--CoA ligase 2-like [Chrysoperla carnea]|uniref:4-coumarate--CoA ligase 2-like n=1 Tax=Chrysoperla carnea TaxID=189513 RepID=UPI001D06A7AD|nr:4-coumarate--CoA ligase 2-like [Chrysoperla carnea]